MADTAAALVIQLSADFKQFKKEMEKATGVFDAGGRKLANRQAQIKKDLSNWTFNFTGLSKFSGAIAGLTAAGVVGGLGALVTKSLNAASAIGDTAIQAGVSVEKLQQLRYAASQSGASFEVIDDGLTQLNRNLGEFINTGAGRAATAFKKIGLDKAINAGQVRDAADAFDYIAARINKFGTESQKIAILARVFGQEAGPKLLQLMESGTDGIARLSDQANSLGIVLSTKTVQGAKEASDKLDALFKVMKAQGISAVAQLAPEIASLADSITKGLPDLITWTEKWAQFFGLIKLSPVDKLKIDLSSAVDELNALQAQKKGLQESSFAVRALSAFGSIFGGGTSEEDFNVLIEAAKKKVAELQAQLSHAQHTAKTIPPVKPAADNRPIAQVAATPAEIALAQKRKEELAKTGVDAATAAAALQAAQDQTNVQLLKGSADYYAAVQKQINDEYTSKVTVAEAEAKKQKESLAKQGTDWAGYAEGVANINAALTDKIAAAAEERKQKLDESGPSGLVRQALIDGDEQIKQYKDETAALGLTAGAAAKFAYVQQQLNEAHRQGITLTKEQIAAILREGDAIAGAAQDAEDANQKFQDAVAVSDEIRSGLSDIGVAALHGFKSAEQAAGQFLEQLAEMILQLYVIKPLLDSILGKQGSVIGGGNGGGGFFSFLGDIGASLIGGSSGGGASAGGAAGFSGFRAKGGAVKPGTWAIAGENGPEPVFATGAGAVVLPNSSLRMPSIPRPSAASAPIISVSIPVDARGAQEGVADQIDRKLRAVAPAIVQAAVSQSRKEFPSNMKRSMRDTM